MLSAFKRIIQAQSMPARRCIESPPHVMLSCVLLHALNMATLPSTQVTYRQLPMSQRILTGAAELSARRGNDFLVM